MDTQELVELMRQASLDGVIEVICPVCKETIVCEADAENSWCYGCGRVVEDINPLIKLGLI